MAHSCNFHGCIADVEVIKVDIHEAPDTCGDMEEVKSKTDKLVGNGPIGICEIQPDHMEVFTVLG